MIKITVSKKGTPAEMEKKLPAIVKDAMKRAAKAWRANVLPTHFDHGAARRYNYQSRSEKYQRLKRSMGSPPALVYTGSSMRKMLSDHREPAGSTKKVTLRMPVNRFFYVTPKSWPKGHNMAKEVIAMNKADLARIYDDVQVRVTMELNALKKG